MYWFPDIRQKIATFDEDRRGEEIIARERENQEELGPGILKSGYEFIDFPTWPYSAYGYTNYFIAWALCPDCIERHFSLQADLAVRKRLHLGWEIRRVLDEILRDRIDLHIVRRHFDADGLDVGQLGSSSRAVRRCALHAAQGRSTSNHQDLARPAFDHLRQHRAHEPR